MIFLENKYKRWYDAIMKQADSRTYNSTLHEKHHYVPTSLGGNDKGYVILTFREHFLAHWLLIKFTEGKAKMKMCYALSCMKAKRKGYHQRSLTAWQYEVSRRASHLIKHTDETKRKISEVNLAQKRVPWNKGKKCQPSPNKGKKMPEHIRAKLRKPKTELHKAKLRQPKTEEHKQKLRDARNVELTTKTRFTFTCPVCDTSESLYENKRTLKRKFCSLSCAMTHGNRVQNRKRKA